MQAQNHTNNDVWCMKAGKLALFSCLQGIVPLIDIYDARCDRKYRGKFVSDTFTRQLYSRIKYFLSTLDRFSIKMFSAKFLYYIIFI